MCLRANASLRSRKGMLCEVISVPPSLGCFAHVCACSAGNTAFLSILEGPASWLWWTSCYCWLHWSQNLLQPRRSRSQTWGGWGLDKLHCRQPFLKIRELLTPLVCTDLSSTDKCCQQGWVLVHNTIYLGLSLLFSQELFILLPRHSMLLEQSTQTQSS